MLHFNQIIRYTNKRLKGLAYISISKTSVKFAKFVFNFCKISTLKYDEGYLKEGENHAHISAQKKKF